MIIGGNYRKIGNLWTKQTEPLTFSGPLYCITEYIPSVSLVVFENYRKVAVYALKFGAGTVFQGVFKRSCKIQVRSSDYDEPALELIFMR